MPSREREQPLRDPQGETGRCFGQVLLERMCPFRLAKTLFDREPGCSEATLTGLAASAATRSASG